MTMRALRGRAPATGSLAVEMAIILPIFVLLLAVPLFFGRVMWFYSVGQKAAHDAARYLSTTTQAEMRSPGGGFNEANVAATARWIAQQELEGILAFTDGVLIDIKCNSVTCGAAVPATVQVGIQITLHDTILGNMTAAYLGSTNMVLTGSATLRYVGD